MENDATRVVADLDGDTNEAAVGGILSANDPTSTTYQLLYNRSVLDNPSATPPSLVVEFRCCVDQLMSQPKAAVGEFAIRSRPSSLDWR